jgi:hypothetical protein
MNECTEDEARQRWCPLSRATFFVRGDLPATDAPVMVAHGANRIVCDDPAIRERIQAAMDDSGGTRCIGSKCMCWTWGHWNGDERLGQCGLVPIPAIGPP